MNYKDTEKILNKIQKICDLKNMTISTENKDWRGRTYKSDFVSLIPQHNTGFEVFDNEIITFFFTAHRHFEDYTTVGEKEQDYVDRSVEFLEKLFKYPIQYVTVTKRNKMVREEYFCLLEKGKKESLTGPSGPLFAFSFFKKKITNVVYWKYDKAEGDFVKTTLEQLGFDEDTEFVEEI